MRKNAMCFLSTFRIQKFIIFTANYFILKTQTKDTTLSENSFSFKPSYVKDRLQDNLNRFIKHESFGGILLAVCVLLAMLVANSHYSDVYFKFFNNEFGAFFSHSNIKISIKEFINDVLMSFFFLLVGLEMKREMLYGELAGFKKVSFSVFAAIGGIICPVALYLYFNAGTQYESGFGVAMSTDTAFALGVIMLLGERVPKILKIFLVTLAVADDLGAISVIAIFYSHDISLEWLLASGLLVCVLAYLNYRDTKHLSLYIFTGILLWICIHHSGIHVTLAAVILAMAIPGRTRVTKRYFSNMLKEFDKMKVETNDWRDVLHTIEEEKMGFFKGSLKNIKNFMKSSQNIEKKIDIAKTSQLVQMLETIGTYAKYAQNPLLRLEHALQPVCAYFIVPLFAFANAGVLIGESLDLSLNSVMLGTILGLLVGKPIGILAFCFIGEKLNLAIRPAGLSYMHILSVGILAGIGFTMSMFVANLAYGDDYLSINLSKIAILIASSIAVVLGIIVILFSTRKQEQTLDTQDLQDLRQKELQALRDSTNNAI